MARGGGWGALLTVFGVALVATLMLAGCCCCLSIPSDRDASTLPLVGMADAIVPLALAFAVYRRQARRNVSAWPTRSVARQDEAAYRSMDFTLETASVPVRVRVAACLAFLDPAMALPTLGLTAAMCRVTGAARVPLDVVLGVVLVLAVCAISAAVGQAILARKASPALAQAVGVGLIVQGIALLGIGLVCWSRLVLRIAPIIGEPPSSPPTFGPTTFTAATALAVLAWPAFEAATGIAFARAASELASAGPPSTERRTGATSSSS
jgi:hypothetical protein